MARTVEEIKEAFEIIDENAQDYISKRPYLKKHQTIIKELVNRSIPMRPVHDTYLSRLGNTLLSTPKCPACKSENILSEEYCEEYACCPDCGQYLDWPKKENK